MNRVRSIAAAAVLVAVVVVTPIALWVWGVGPAALTNLLRSDDGSTLLAVLTLTGWAAWAAFTVSVLVEAVNVIGRRAVPIRLPLLGGLQSIAGALVFAALAPAVPAGAAPVTSAAEPAPITAEHVSGSVEEVGIESPDPADTGYLVRPGDDLWSVAEQLLGDGRQWRTLAEANPDLLANPTVDLVPGTRLALPAESPAPGTHAQRQVAGTVTVQKGDTLSALADTYLGNASRWPRIYRANPERIDDPDVIDVGWKLVIPPRPSIVSAVPEHARPPRRPVANVDLDPPVIASPAPAQPSAAPASVVATNVAAPTVSASRALSTTDPAWPLIGGLGAATAAIILTGLGASRLAQIRARPLGHRIGHPPVDVRRYETALGRRQRPESPALLEKALRHLGAHAHATGRPLPGLDRVVLDDGAIAFHWRRPAGEPPAGFKGGEQAWSLSARTSAALPECTHPVPFPALVSLGRDETGSWLMVDLESRCPLTLSGARALRHAAVAAMAVELSCAPWAAELSLTVVGGDEMFVRAACPELVRFESDPHLALDALEALVAERGSDDSPTVLLRVDPDRAEAGAAQITLFADELPPEARTRLHALLDADLGVSAVVAGDAVAGGSALVLSGTEDDPAARLDPESWVFGPQLIAAHTRAAIGTIFAATDERAHDPAPWWSEQDADNVRTLMPRRGTDHILVSETAPDVPGHPYLMMLGPIALAGAAGPAPTRSRRQCEEYCAWLLENPRSTATRMTNELVVAETTRRSNMSRLRSWLGNDPDGQPYLPEAYSGRIELHDEVSSDWQRLQLLVAPGLNRLAPETLVSVLELVRGAPLADAAPGQWRWAEELRTDMASMVRDTGVLLTRWAVEHSDVDLARWAAARALLASPEDELLLVERINTEHLAGNTAEVQRLVRWVTGQARVLGMDLAPETVDACQRAMEGRTRPRAIR